MAALKTKPTDSDPVAFLDSVSPEQRQQDGHALNALFSEVTGWTPKMWGSSIIGYGFYDYTYTSGRSGRWMATGFSPRKAQLSIYIMPGYQDFSPILDRLGPHSHGKSCLYIRKLERVDMQVLGELISEGLKRLDKIWPVSPS